MTSGALVRKDPQEPADRPDGREGARHVQHHLPKTPGQGRPLDQWGGGEGARHVQHHLPQATGQGRPLDQCGGGEGARHVQHHLPQAPGQGRPLDQWGGGEGANLFMRLNFLKLFFIGELMYGGILCHNKK